MSRREGELVYRRMRAPQVHGSAFIDPDWSTLDTPHSILEACGEDDFAVLDSTRTQLAKDARRQLLRAAVNANGDPPPEDFERPIIMSGHQPELFHPGVWFKNFALARLGQQFGAIAVNLVIDSDLCRSTAVRCPRYDRTLGEPANPSAYRVEPIEFDSTWEAEPYEERRVNDPDRFRSFPEHVATALHGVVEDPIATQMWPAVLERFEEGERLGAMIAAGRRAMEAKAGVVNWESLQSTVCESDAFHRFLLHLLVHAPKFAELHNAALEAYRRVNRIRSQSHPAPRLVEKDGWTETPFWIWTERDSQRRRAYVRTSDNSSGSRELVFGSPENLEIALPSPDQSPAGALSALREASAAGVRIRSRALATTMYARLFLSDLFVHGIGGAKYDQLTDELMRRFWGVNRPPPFVTVTATTQLPLPRSGIGLNAVRETDATIRSMRFHPEWHLTAPPRDAQALIQEKQQLVKRKPPRGEGRRRRDRLDEINRLLQSWLDEQTKREQRRRAQCAEQLRVDRVLGSREYSFCLHSWTTLPALLLDLCGKPS